MKKFLTFFAMMFALLGFSIPASAADYTVYVDVSAKGWSDCYLKTHYSDNANEGWHIPTVTKSSLGNGLYKFVFSYDGLKDVIISKNNDADNRGNEGTDNVGWFSPSKSGDWYFGTDKLYTLSSGNTNSAKVTDYKESNPPYIYIDGASHPFTAEGTSWVHTVDASSGSKEFRLQNKDDNTALGTNVVNTALVPDGLGHEATSNISSTTSCALIEYGNFSGRLVVDNGYTYKLIINSGLSSMTITKTASKPATPVLPASATNNKIAIPAVSGATVYYTEAATGDPSVDSWTEYPADGIALEKGYTTIRAAAYKEGLGWSDVAAAKTYKYDLPEVKIEIDVHTGKATLTPLVALSTLPASANAVILYSCGPDAPNKVYTPGTPVDMENECTVEGATRYPIKALVRAWGDGDGSVAVANQSVDSDVRNAQWIGPAAVRRICLWNYGPTGNPVRVGEFTKQDDKTYVLSYSPVSGTNTGDATQHYYIRVVMNHDEPNNVASDAGGTFYSLGNANEVVSVASGTEYTSFNRFTPSASDTRGMFFDGADRDAVKLTLKGDLDAYTLEGSTTECSRFVPNSIVPEWNPDANIKSVELRDANNKLLCTLTQALGTGEENYWTGVTTEALKKATDSGGDTRFCFVADTKDGKKYYSIGEQYNYWVNYGRYDSTTSHKPSTSSASGHYFSVNETSAIAEVAIAFDGTTASKISISPYTNTKQMDISGTPNAPAITGYGSEVGSWDSTHEFNHSVTLGGWVYTFTATQSTPEYLIYGSKGNLYAPIGLQIGSPHTTVWRQVPSGLDANGKKRYAAKLSGLQVGARYRLILKEVGNDVQISIEALPESVRKIKKVELVNRTSGNTVVGEFTQNTENGTWDFYPLSWTGNPSNSSVYSDAYYVKVTLGYEGEGDASDYVRYVGWSASVNDYQLESISQYSNKAYTYSNVNDNHNFKVRVNGDYYVQVAFDEATFTAGWMGVATSKLTPSFIPQVNRVAWSLSDDRILVPGDTKYFYMSAMQNDNRLSPEWELVKEGGKYVLDNFVVIPAAQFVIRAVSKSQTGQLTVTDWGYNGSVPYHIYATGQDFNIDKVEGLNADSKVSAPFTMTAGRDRGFFWNVGTSMVRLEFDPSAATNNLIATIDFSYPSTLKQAPKPGFPWVGLTSSNIQALSGSNQSYSYAAKLGLSGMSADDLKNIGIESSDELEASFTNAFIQWSEDGKPYIYDRHVDDTDVNGKSIYYVSGNAAYDNRATSVRPSVDQVMNSTILPPRNAPQFQMITTKGVTTPDADALTFKYIDTKPMTFTYHGNTTKKFMVAEYEISNIELQGMFKVFTGYGARNYGSVTNGLSYYPNWGVGVQKDSEPYANMLISSTQQLPMNGGGQIITTDDGREVSTRYWNQISIGDNGDYTKDDNTAGQYFRLDNAQYVSSLKFYLALECDTDDRNSKTFHNPHEGDAANVYNDGRNYSWLDVVMEAERPVIQLNKQGTNTGVARFWLNQPVSAEPRPKVMSYKTRLYKVDPDTFDYDKETGEILAGAEATEYGNTYTLSEPYNSYIEEKTTTISNLPEGTYYAFIYEVEYVAEEGFTIKETDTWNISHPITIFSVKQGQIRGEQRVGQRDQSHIYHPVVRVYPDIQTVIKDLPSGITLDKVSATVTLGNLRADSYILDTNGNPITKKDAVDADATDIYYVVTQEYKSAEANGGTEQEGKAVVYYPQGYFSVTGGNVNTQNFDIVKTRLNALTHLTLDVAVEGAENPASVTAEAMTYMPAGQLYGTLVADKKESGDVHFNALSVTHGDEVEGADRDGYARIRYVDRNNGDIPCYIGTMDGTGVFAQVYYVGKDDTGAEVDIPLFDKDALLDMKANPDDDKVYTAKRLKIGGIPYVTENDATDDLATDIDGTELKLRHEQKAKFKVVLTYKNEGIDMPEVTTRTKETELTYGEENLTSPRQGLHDVLTKADADARLTDETVAKDVTAVSERYVENYGGLFTNIEDAHVALHAVEKNNALVGDRSLRKWYMDHGDKWIGTEDLNPFNPGNHLAIGNAKNGTTDTYAAPEEVHPLLRGTKVESTDGFRNDSELNNAWWNHNALVAPEFHEADQINGTLTIEGGKVTGFTPGSAHPKNHRAYWAGVKPGNSDKYQVWDGDYVIKAPEGFDVDIRDPQHGYYGMSNHFSTKRSGFYLGEMPLDANDVTAVLGRGNGMGSGSFTEDQRSQFYTDAKAVHAKAMEFHKYSEDINAAVNAGNSSVTVGDNTYTIDWNTEYPWDYDPIYDVREKAAFEPQTAGGLSPAEELFETADRHMFFKVRHINHESWFVPGTSVAEGTLKTQPLWAAFENDAKFQAAATPTAKDNYVMSQLRVNPEDYCPLAYDVRYTYPFLTSDKYVTAENYDNSKNGARRKARSTEPGAIKTALDGVGEGDVDDIVARDKGRVSFFGYVSPEDVVPTAISDVNDDIRGNGFSIVYNRAAGTVTVKAEGKTLENAAVYDASGASLVTGTSADRIDDSTIVLDVRNIARGAYVVSTNLGGAKFMK